MPRAGLDTEAVVDAAARMADAGGLDSVTLARLAEVLGVRPPSLYAHVDGLSDLRRRLGARGARELASALQRTAAGRAGTEALTAVARAYRSYAHAHPGLYTAFQPAPGREDEPDYGAAVQTVLAVLRGYGLEGDEAIHAARAARAALHGFVTLERDGGFGIPLALDDSFDRLVQILDRGLAGGGQPPAG